MTRYMIPAWPNCHIHPERPLVHKPPAIILIKTSSMGDVLHNLPVVTDILKHFPDAAIDWVAEESFAALPSLHPGVRRVLAVAVRRWRKSWWASRHEMRQICGRMNMQHYDFAIDTQGLLKSALISRCAKAPRCGFDRRSAREPLASLFYDRSFFVAKEQHAVERNRQLVAQVLGYNIDSPADYGIRPPAMELPWLPDGSYVALLHATSRDDKLWHEPNWIALGTLLAARDIRAVLPWGSEREKARAERLAAAIPGAICAPHLKLDEAAAMLGRAKAVVGVDTGLSHLAAALGVPTIGIYTATDPGLTGLYAGEQAVNLGGRGTAPGVEAVLQTLKQLGTHA